MRWFAPLAMVVLSACSGSRRSVPERRPAASAVAGSATDAASALAPPPAPENAPRAAAAPGIAPPGTPPLAPGCEAPSLDLRSIFEGGACRVDEDAIPTGALPSTLPETVRVRVEPAIAQVRRGEPVHAEIRLDNTGTEPADVYVSYICGPRAKELVSAHIEQLVRQERVDIGGRRCGRGCGGGAIRHHVRLPPGGVARYPFEASTRIEWFDDHCEASRRAPIAAGNYRLVVRGRFLPDRRSLDAELRIVEP